MSASTEPQDAAALLHASDGASSKQLEISNAVVRIHKRYLGRGPRSAHTHLSHELAVVVLMGALTRAEQSLYEAGEHDLVMSQRHAMQQLMADDMITAVKAITGRDVISFMSTNDPENELGVELFLFEAKNHST